MYTLLEALRIAALSIYPFMPGTAKGIWEQLGMQDDIKKAGASDLIEWGKTKVGSKINKLNALFPRIEVS